MLTRCHRLTSSSMFARTVRRGRRAGTSTVVLHLNAVPESVPAPAIAQVGFVVGKAVGPAVTRNRVKRQLRHLVRGRIDVLPSSSVLVVRATSGAASATYARLGDDLDAALRRLGLRTAGDSR